jgi:PAS domain S-box-containing protein
MIDESILDLQIFLLYTVGAIIFYLVYTQTKSLKYYIYPYTLNPLGYFFYFLHIYDPIFRLIGNLIYLLVSILLIIGAFREYRDFIRLKPKLVNMHPLIFFSFPFFFLIGIQLLITVLFAVSCFYLFRIFLENRTPRHVTLAIIQGSAAVALGNSIMANFNITGTWELSYLLTILLGVLITFLPIVTYTEKLLIKARDDLKESEEKYRRLFETSPIGIGLSTLDGRVITMNKSLEGITGYTYEEFVKINLSESYVDPQRRKEFVDLLKQHKKVRDFEVHLKRKDGMIFTALFYSDLINIEDEVFVLNNIRDITEIKNSERKIKESEEKYRTLFEQGPDMIFIIDPETDNIVESNHRVHDILGYTIEEFQGKRLSDIEVKESAKEIKHHIREIIDLGRDFFETQHRTKNGNVKNILVSTRTIKIGEKTYIQAFCRDITERKLAEEKLKESEIKYRTITEQSIAAIGIFQNGEFKYVNTVYEDFFGYTKAELYAMSVDELIDSTFLPEDQDWAKQYTRITQNGKRSNYGQLEFFIISKKNERRWILSQSKSIQFRGDPAAMNILFDITERKDIQLKLKESEEKYKNLIDTSSMGLIEIDFSSRQIAYINPRMLEIVGYTNEEMLEEREFERFVHPEDFEEMDFSKTEKKLEFRVITKEGRIKWLSGDCLHLYDDEGNITYIRLWVQDITEKKQLEQLKKDLLIRFSHEFKTPLISIKGFSELLIEEYRDKLDEKIISFLEKIKVGANMLKDLTNVFLESTQLDENLVKLNIKQVDITDLIRGVINELEGNIKLRRQIVDLKLKEGVIITCDPEKIRMVLSNVILNASKFTPKEGLISVTIATEEGELLITIKDNGIGLTKDEIEKLFVPFGKIERYGQGLDIIPDGMGMGLYISKGLVELHGGTIWAESKGRNKGSTFCVTIPIDHEN